MVREMIEHVIASHSRENFKIITKNLSNQPELHARLKAIEQTNFTANLDLAGQACMSESVTKHFKN